MAETEGYGGAVMQGDTHPLDVVDTQYDLLATDENEGSEDNDESIELETQND